MTNRVFSFAAVLALFALLGAPALAAPAAGDRVVTEHAESALLPARYGFAPGEVTWFAFEQKIEPGWHVYWKNPGDSGLPLDFQWTLPEGFSAGDIIYPTPERIPVGPLANFGHHGNPVFIAPITAPEDLSIGEDIAIGLTATWLICEEICVPETGEFAITLPATEAPETLSRGSDALARARQETPGKYEGEAAYFTAGDKLFLRVDDFGGDAKEALFFPEAEGLIEPAADQTVTRENGGAYISMEPGFSFDAEASSAIRGVLVLIEANERRGYELTAEKIDPPAGAVVAVANNAGAVSDANASGGSLPLLLIAAFVGGLILNVMPCVFPIIFIKAASLTQSAQRDAGAVRRHGFLYTLGVVATFAALGGVLLALRAGGAQLGWGFHLQSPIVVALSAYILLLVGLNLAGVFSVGESLQGAGAGLVDKGGNKGAFFTGALAVVVAAPCIGPLMSAPMAAAVVLPPAVGMLIFVAMALGLAAPFLLISLAPALGRLLPKPGGWMKIFKQALAFPVFAAAAYFLWVLAQQTSPGGLAKTLAGAVLLSVAAWLFQLSKGDGLRAIVVRAGAALAALAAILPVAGLKIAETPAAQPKNYGALETIQFDQSQIDQLRSEGRSVFVDFTAAWCVTCQFNKLTVLSKQSVSDAFARNDVAFMVADWTARDPEITVALESFGANGVPLYVFFPPRGEPMILPLPLTEAAIIDVVSKNSAKETNYAEKS